MSRHTHGNGRNGLEQQQVILRIPGPWRRTQDLELRLKDGFRLQRDTLIVPSGRAVAFELLPADREFPSIFRLACRRPLNSTSQRSLDSHAMIAALIAPAGSMAAARFILEAGAGLMHAGGIGVFVDNGLIAHSGSDWLELAENAHDPAAVFYAFVNVAKFGNQLRSHGMHVLGFRDGIANRVNDLNSLEDFLRMSSATKTVPTDGETFADENGRKFRLRAESSHDLFAKHPINNPHGLWRLEPI